MVRSIKPSFAIMAILFLLNSITFFQLAGATHVPVTTCRTFFNQKGDDICSKRGFHHKANPDKMCHNGVCSVNKCCYNVCNITCRAFFNQKGDDICSKRGFHHKANPDKMCNKGVCNVNKCCYNVYVAQQSETCGEFFQRKNKKNICQNNGFAHQRGKQYQCKGKNCNIKQCCYGQPSTCGDYYASNIEGTGICSKSGLKHFKPANTTCYNAAGQLIPCTVKQCCYVENCGDYFDRKKQGTGICRKNNWAKPLSRDVVCEVRPGEKTKPGEPCTAAQCCM